MKFSQFTLQILFFGLLFACLSALPVRAQGRMGYLDVTQLIYSMPEGNTIRKEMRIYVDKLTERLETKQAYIDAQTWEYDSLASTMSAQKLQAERRLLHYLQKELDLLIDDARIMVQVKMQNLMEPIHDKIASAIQAVIAEQGLLAVVNTSDRPFDSFGIPPNEMVGDYGFGHFRRSGIEQRITASLSCYIFQAQFVGKDATDVRPFVLRKLGIAGN